MQSHHTAWGHNCSMGHSCGMTVLCGDNSVARIRAVSARRDNCAPVGRRRQRPAGAAVDTHSAFVQQPAEPADNTLRFEEPRYEALHAQHSACCR